MADGNRKSALEGHLEAGEHGARPVGVTLREWRPAALCLVNGANAIGLGTLGVRGDAGVGLATSGPGIDALGTGPGQWLVVEADASDSRALAARAAAALGPGDVTVTDLGHARTVLRIAGPRVRDLLAKGCPVDVDAMAPGTCAGTVFAYFNVLVHRREPEVFDLYVFRSFGVALLELLLVEAAEFGCEVIA